MIEAWLSGVPIVTTPTGIAHELADEYGPMAIEIPFDPRPEETAAAVKRAVGQEGQKISRKARTIADREFTEKVMLKRWTTFLSQCVATS